MTASQPTGLLLIQSSYGPPPGLFAHAETTGQGRIVPQRALTAGDFAAARGVVTTMHLDQIDFLRWSDALAELLARGGRWFFNGHILRPLLPELEPYVPIPQAGRADLVLTRLADHPIFDGIEQSDFEENRGVAGFYGRGHNPMPDGARAINGVGPDRLPIDWEWIVPGGGRMFSHAGNDIGGMGGRPAHEAVGERILAWALGA